MKLGKELLDYSIHSLGHRLGRSALTVLSIFVGIATIFVFISFGLGLYSFVGAYSSGTSVDKVAIMPKGGTPGLDDTFALTENDLTAVKKTAGVYEATGLYWKVAEVKQDKVRKYTFLISYEIEKPLFFEFANIKLAKGRNLRSGDSGKVVLGYNYLVKDRIFPKAFDINQKIEIQGKDYRIIGFYEPIGNPQDDSQIYMSNDDFKELYQNSTIRGYSMIISKVDVSIIDTVIKRIEKAVRKSRDLDVGKEDFFVQSFEDLIATYSSVLKGIAAFVILIAFISVLVSAINTANTMITSVIERTREIGVMKAVGARNSEVFRIFLFESAILGLVAGIFGVLAGFAITYLAGNYLSSIGWSLLKPYYSFGLFFNLILFATLTGAISGAIPAYQASKVNPVKALRYE